MYTVITYICEYCNGFKNIDNVEVFNHELGCPFNPNAVPPETEDEEFDIDKYIQIEGYCRYEELLTPKSIKHWEINYYKNQFIIVILNDKRILSYFDMKAKLIKTQEHVYTIDQLERFGQVLFLVFEDLSD